MLPNHGYGFAAYDVVPFHPDVMDDRWLVMWGPNTCFGMGRVFQGRDAADAFAADQRATEAVVGGRTGDWFQPIPPGTRVVMKHGGVVAAQCGMLVDDKWPHNAGGLVMKEGDHAVTVLLEGRNTPDVYSKRWVWVMP